MADWQPIETAPRDGAAILLGRPADEENDAPGVSVLGWWEKATPDGCDYMGNDAGFVDCHYSAFRTGRSFGNPSHQYEPHQPTHWQPLPTPPHWRSPMADWQPIETAKKDAPVDLWVVGDQNGPLRLPDCEWLNGEWATYSDKYGWIIIERRGCVVTHWMPRPGPPQEEPHG